MGLYSSKGVVFVPIVSFLFRRFFQSQPPERPSADSCLHCSPGRWMASAVMKLVFAHLLLHFDVLPGSSTGPLTVGVTLI